MIDYGMRADHEEERRIDAAMVEAMLPPIDKIVKPTVLDTILTFWRTYDRLSEEGAADSVGGMESTRVFTEWLEAARPEPEAFIRRRANAPLLADVFKPEG